MMKVLVQTLKGMRSVGFEAGLRRDNGLERNKGKTLVVARGGGFKNVVCVCGAGKKKATEDTPLVGLVDW